MEQDFRAGHEFVPNESGYCTVVGEDGMCMWEKQDHM